MVKQPSETSSGGEGAADMHGDNETSELSVKVVEFEVLGVSAEARPPISESARPGVQHVAQADFQHVQVPHRMPESCGTGTAAAKP